MTYLNKTQPEVRNWIDKERNQLLNSATRLILLAIIDKNPEVHGYNIATELESQTRGEISKTTASFYAILRRLVKDNLVEYREGDSLKGPPRKYYYLTNQGKDAMKALYQNWVYYFQIISEFENLTGE